MTPAAEHTSLAYRPDVDGLRAIAVSLVILGHAGVTAFPGGFIGVDVFFVISGFLITSILFTKLSRDSFSFLWFYERRIKRLMPVLFLVIAVTLGASTLILLPKDLEKLSMSVVWVTLFAGNVFFWREYGGYFADDSQTAGLLHTWSLAVEEQYYFVWPIALLLMLRWFGPRWTAVLCVVGLVPTVWISQYGTEQTIGAAYYLLPTRFFELLAGSALALVPTLLSRERPGSIDQILGLIGLAIMLWSAMSLTEASPFPGYNAIPPVLGTLCLLIASGSIVNRVLATAPVVYIGKLSYSLYLWHWPVLSLMHYAQVPSTALTICAAIGLTFALAATGYHLLENPLRMRRYASKRTVFVGLYALPATVLIGVALTIRGSGGLPQRFDDTTVAMDAAVHEVVHEQREGCHVPARQSRERPSPECRFGEANASAAPTLFIFGDSHANHLVPFLAELAESTGAVGQDYSMDRCPPLIGLRYGVSDALAARCQARNEQAAAHISRAEFDVVVLAASWPGDNTNRIFSDAGRLRTPGEIKQALLDALDRTIAHIDTSGARPLLIRETPVLEDTSPKCPLLRDRFNEDLDCHAVLYRNTLLDEILPELQAQWPTLVVIDPGELLCEGSSTNQSPRCKMQLGNTPLFSDDNHLNVAGSRALARLYLASNPNPLADDVAELPQQQDEQ